MKKIHVVIKEEKVMNKFNITPFFKKEFGEIRVIEIEGKPHFVGNDIAKALGYSNPHKALKDHCKKVTKVCTNDSLGRQQETNIIPEGDLYRLISKSKLPQAEKFESWVFDEVLPTIRKHGMYAKDELLNNPDLMLAVVTELKQEREQRKQLELEKAILIQQNGELKHKADYTDMVLQNKSLMTITAIAKDYGMSGGALNKKLHELGIQYKQGNQWFLYAKHQAKGYTSSTTQVIPHKDGSTEIKLHTKWTQKGRLFIYKELKKIGIVPLIEQDLAS